MENMQTQAIVFGAGNVGRGFLGQLFSESGYHVCFVDVDAVLIDTFRARGAYTIRLVDNAHTEEVRVGPVTGLLASDAGAVAEALAAASLGATAVGARALPHVAPAVAAGIRLRAERGVEEPLNLIICENLKGAAAIFRGMVFEHLDDAGRRYAAGHVGFVDTVIGRMVPELTPELRAQDPTLIIVEPYKELPVDRAGFVGPIPEIVGMEPSDDFALFTARKLYLHNAGHAILGYLGYRYGHTLGYEALEDPYIRPVLDGALEEALQGIVRRHGADEAREYSGGAREYSGGAREYSGGAREYSGGAWLRAHVADLLERFANRALADPVLRLARDPLRKLAPDDRLVGAARVAEAAGHVPVNLALGIAAALAFDAPEDPSAQELQGRIAREGVESVLASVCAIDSAEPLGRAVLERYQRLLGSGA